MMLRAPVRKRNREGHGGEVPARQAEEALAAAAEAAIRQARSGELRSVSCDFHHGVLTLRGQVSSYYLKQLAQELIRAMAPGGQVDNKLSVDWSALGG